MTAGPPEPGQRASEIQGTGGAGVHLLREPPLGQSILWHQTSPTIVQRKPPSGPYPVFFDQKAIIAVNAHYETAGRQGMMGFLVGDLFESPTTHQRFVVIDSTIRLNQAVYGDKTLVIVSRLWDRIQEELRKTEGHLIGWYHSHPPITVELAPGDVETHLQYFKRPWHVALVLASEHEGPVAGLFRPKPGETAASASLPFYELIEEGEDGATLATKQSVLPWINYLTDDKAAKYANGEMPEAATPPPSASALQVVKPASPTPKPAPAIPATPSGKVAAVKPAAVTPKPAPAVPAAPAKPAAPAPPAAATSTTGTLARPALGDRPQPAQPSPPPSPPKPPAAPPPVVAAPPAVASPPPRRDTQMKSPPNALSNLPIVEAGGYHLGDVDARASEPGVVRPRSRETEQAPPLTRPAGSPFARPAIVPKPYVPKVSTPRPFAPALAPRSDGHPGLVAFFVMALVIGGGFAGWKYWWLPNHAAQAAAPARGARSGTSTTPDTAKPAGTTAPATSHSPPATAVAIDSPLVQLDRNADSVTVGVVGYGGLVQSGRTGCDALSPALVAVEDAWKRYNLGKKRLPPLDGDRFLRDQRLVASVDSVEGDFDRSGCSRP